MIITISGLHGTGKSTVGKLIAENLNIRFYSTGNAFRDLAEEMGMSLEEFTLYVEKNPGIDNKLDDKVVSEAKKGNIIIDSQLSAYLLEDIADCKILLTCPIETRVRRMAERDSSNYEEKLKETAMREKSELDRFIELYDIDLSNNDKTLELYDLIINTENMTIKDVCYKIVNNIRRI